MKVFVTGLMGPAEEVYSLRAEGHEVVVGREGPAHSEPELQELCRDADVILAAFRDAISRKVLEASDRLRLVVVPFIGVDNIDVEAATELGILVANSPSPENVIGMAEVTIGLMLSLLKHVKRNEARLRGGEWRRPEDRGDILYGKAVGIVGLGRIGSHVARRLAAWEVTLLANDPYISPDHAKSVNARLTDLPALLRASDIVTLHVVYTNETRGLIGERELKAMKPTAFLLNTARGGVVDEGALARAIEEGWIAGAALDTFEQEPLPQGSPLRRLDPQKVILTPHNVGLSEAGRRANFAMALRNIRQAFGGEPPDHTKNREAIPRWQERLRKLGA